MMIYQNSKLKTQNFLLADLRLDRLLGLIEESLNFG